MTFDRDGDVLIPWYSENKIKFNNDNMNIYFSKNDKSLKSSKCRKWTKLDYDSLKMDILLHLCGGHKWS